MGKGRDSKAAKAKRDQRRGETRARAEQKSSKSEQKKDKKDANKKDEEDLDALLAEFKAMQADTKTVKEEVVPPPSPRANCTLTIHPTKEELLLFGGERYDGQKNILYADLFRYSIKRNEWKHVHCPNSPPPRAAHQAVAVPSSGGSLFVFGGEFTSSNQTQFHHYRDFWCLDLATWTWEQVTAKNGPSARSGHRMVHVRDQLIVFGGFFDNLRDVRYFNDLHIFDLSLYKWTRVTPEPGAPVPSPRSGFQMVTDPTGGADGSGCVLLYGGYFKKKVVNQQFDSHKDKSQVEELSDTGVEHRDLWSFDPSTGQWDTLKKSGTPPSSRSGYNMVFHKKRLVVFGGVHDEDTPDGESMISTFYSDLHAYALETGKWFELGLVERKRGVGKAVKSGGGASKAADEDGAANDDSGAPDSLLLDAGGRRRNRNKKGGGNDDDDDDECRLKPSSGGPSGTAGDVKTAAAAADVGSVAGASGTQEGTTAPAAALGISARMNAACALRGNMLFVYGGLYEPEEAAELTLSDLWSLDLAKLDGWGCLHEGEALEKSLVKEEDSEESDDDDDDDDSDG